MKERLIKFGFFLIFSSAFLLIFMPVKQAISMGLGIAVGQIFIDYIREK